MRRHSSLKLSDVRTATTGEYLQHMISRAVYVSEWPAPALRMVARAKAFAPFIAAVLIFGSSPTVFGASTWFFKIVDESENPITGAAILWKDSEALDLTPLEIFSLGPNGIGGTGDTLAKVKDLVDENRVLENQALADATANYQAFISPQKRHTTVLIKVRAPRFRPVELRIAPRDGAVQWQKVVLLREPDIVVGQAGAATVTPSSHVINAVPPIRVVINVGGFGAIPRNAVVAVTEIATGITQSARVDEHGTAVLSMVNPGMATVQVQCEGFTPKTWRMELEALRTNTTTVELTPVRRK